MRSRAPLRYALLALALAAIAVVHFHPYWNVATGERNELPTHMDDYVHWGRAKAALDQGTVAYAEPFAPRGSDAEFEFRAELHERGYHAYLAALQDATGLDWLVLWQYVPVTMALLLGLAVFIVAERWNAGVEAALWVALIPTTLRFLGPAFMVPIAFSLPLFVAALFALFHLRGGPRLAALAILLSGVWPIHTMASLALSALILLEAPFRLRRNTLEGILQIAIVALPILLVWPYIAASLSSRLGPQELPLSLREARLAGPILFVAATIGAAFLTASRDTIRAGSILAALTIAILALAIARAVSGADVLGIYDRSLMIVYVLAAILAGVGIARLRDLGTAALTRAGWKGAGAVVLAVLILAQGAAVATAVKPQLDQPYYEILTEARYERYQQAAVLLNGTHRLALVDGTSSMAFSTITDRPLSFTFYPSTPGIPGELEDFFAAGASDTRFLVERGVTIVATERSVANPDLIPIADGIYVLRDDYVRRIAAAQEVKIG